MKKKHYLKGDLVKLNKDEGVLDAAIASSETLDRQGESVKLSGIDIKNFKKNPILLWAHNAHLMEDRPPIGKVERIWFEGVGKKQKLMFRPKFDLQDKFAADIFRKYKEGFLSAFSIGFLSKTKEDNVHEESELLEISAVPVPANPEALVQIRSMKHHGHKIEPVDWNGFFDNKTVVPYSPTSTTDDGAGWDAAAARRRVARWAGGPDKDKISWSKYRRAFTWYDAQKADSFGAYKLPHHDIVNGKLTVIWRGVAAAMAALLGARGGTNIPEGDRQAVYNHLKRHYAQYDKEPPEYRMVENQLLKSLNTELDAFYMSIKARKDRVVGKNKKPPTRYGLSKISSPHLKKPKPKPKKDFKQEAVKALKILNQATNLALHRLKVKGGKGGEQE